MAAPPAGRHARSDAALVLVAAVWGSTFVLVKSAVAPGGPFLFLAVRFALAAAVLAVPAWRRLWHAPAEAWRAGAGVGLFLYLGYGFQTIGLRYTGATPAAFLTSLFVVFVPFLLAALERRRPAWRDLTAALVAAAGTWLLIDPRFGSVSPGDLLCVACAVAFAAHIVVLGRVAGTHDPVVLATVQIGAVALFALPAVLLFELPMAPPAPTFWYAAALTGLVATALAFFVQTSAQRVSPPGRIAVIFAAEPAFAALFGVVWAGESLTPRAAVGAVLIFVAVLAVLIRRQPTPSTSP